MRQGFHRFQGFSRALKVHFGAASTWAPVLS